MVSIDLLREEEESIAGTSSASDSENSLETHLQLIQENGHDDRLPLLRGPDSESFLPCRDLKGTAYQRVSRMTAHKLEPCQKNTVLQERTVSRESLLGNPFLSMALWYAFILSWFTGFGIVLHRVNELSNGNYTITDLLEVWGISH